MINYSVNNFFDKKECLEIIDFMSKHSEPFAYTPEEYYSWDCRKTYDESFKEKIFNKFKSMWLDKKLDLWFNFDNFEVKDLNITLTKYYDGRYLELHRDAMSELSTVIVLTEDFEDGRFVLSKDYLGKNFKTIDIDSVNKVKLDIGQGITFNGSKTFHGVLPVTKGLRCSLNIWMSNSMVNNQKKIKTII